MTIAHQHFNAAIRLFFGGVLLVLTGCSTTGTYFDASRIDLINPGQTTLAQVSGLLKADPVDIYHQGDGSMIARWAHRASFVPDALYFNRELWLQFDTLGYFERIVKSINVSQIIQFDRATYTARPQPDCCVSGPSFSLFPTTPTLSKGGIAAV